jgi:hypothetical protein
MSGLKESYKDYVNLLRSTGYTQEDIIEVLVGNLVHSETRTREVREAFKKLEKGSKWLSKNHPQVYTYFIENCE